MKYRKKIKEIRFPDLSTAFSEKTRYFVFFGADEPKDVVHQRFFAEHKGDLEIILVKGCGHDVAGFLKSSGNLYSIIGACRSGDDVKRIIGSDNICTV